MSTLTAQSIRATNLITPFHERSKCRGLSYGVGPASYDVRIAQDLLLPPLGLIRLASTIEYFTMPNDVKAVVHDKSTWVRKGITVQNTVIDPGWRGYLTLEIANHTLWFRRIYAGDPIAQIVFDWLDDVTEQPYVGKYQDQEPGAQEARYDNP